MYISHASEQIRAFCFFLGKVTQPLSAESRKVGYSAGSAMRS
ncbi:hypothetical protein N500_0370 [Wolbachia pipientis wUni]|nr:hypothetical protein N500_0370 [Wolbachia pipientis wUni]